MFNAISKNGELDFGSDSNLARFKQWLKDREGKRIRIGEITSTRTILQNRFYWCYLGIIERETGQDAQDIHEIAKRKFLPPRFVNVMGKEFKLPSTTTKLSKTEMSDFMDKICYWTNIPIPDPNELEGYIQS